MAELLVAWMDLTKVEMMVALMVVMKDYYLAV